jgi:hypothetical protein
MILLAFADYMDFEGFKKKVPSAKKIGIARLPGYTFIFDRTDEDQSSKANIIQTINPNDVVWGVLIELDDAEKINFFNAGTSSDFMLETVTCMDQNDKVYTAEAFVALPHAVNTHLLPYSWYIQKIVDLAKKANLPEGYVNKLAMVPSKSDPDEATRQKD